MEKISTISWKNLKETMQMSEKLFDIVRLVDPNKQRVVTIDEAGNLEEGEECFEFWKTASGCSNCTGLCAYERTCVAAKTEKRGEQSFQVSTCVVYVVDAEKKIRKLVMEFLSETVVEKEKTGNTILIVDDQKVNRMLAAKILSDKYKILEASDGQEALDVLENEYEEISVVILDLIMPGYDGYTTLKFMHNDERFSDIPVIIMSGETDWKTEKKCLEAGAWDLLSKPVNKEILRNRVQNVIGRSRYNEQYMESYSVYHDELTGLFNRKKFFQDVCQKELWKEPGEYVIMHIDIDRFRLYTSFFGEEEGNKLLKFLADILKQYCEKLEEAILARIESDVFAICCRYDKALLDEFGGCLEKALQDYNETYYISPSIGIYVNTSENISAEGMFDRATMAVEQCKHKFIQSTAYYSNHMSEHLVAAQEIMNDAQKALDEEQFEVYLQPKTNIHTESLQGAEALVRWVHPEKGLVMPGSFIPIFEKNGFIGQLDYYMWEHTCKLIRKWIDEGLEPAPVSVNVSRANMYHPNFVERLMELLKKYNLSPKYLQLELTESAFMDDPDMMIEQVKALQKQGFTILMDDFGSGYSSLNALKDIPVDILKVDMKFLGSDKNDGRSERILASVVRMAEWLDLIVIVEGVETIEQRNFLESIGCEYAQGFYYARPMPWQEYETVLRELRRHPEDPSQPVKDIDIAGLADNIWKVNPALEHLFHTAMQPMALCQYSGSELKFLHINSEFSHGFGYNPVLEQGRQDKYVPDEQIAEIRSAFKECATTYKITMHDYIRLNDQGESFWYRIRLQHVISIDETEIIMAYFENIHEEKLIEIEVDRYKNYEQEKNSRAAMLIVDDSGISRYVSRELFKSRFQIYEAENGKEALEVLKEHGNEVAIILLDMNMPVMDGQEFLKIKNDKKEFADIPVVVVSAEDRQELQIDMLKNGVNDYVTKPFVPEVVERRVLNVLEYSSRFRSMLREYRETCN